jgi:hypothetical protein
MNLQRVKLIALIVCAIAALPIPPATAQAATSATTASLRPAVNVQPCEYAHALLHYDYFEADRAMNLDWWGTSESATTHYPVVLKNRSTGSPLDCFKVFGGFSGSRMGFQLYHLDLCLNVAGNSQAIAVERYGVRPVGSASI